MDANELISLVGSLGFPIVAYGGMFWYMVRMNDAHKSEIDALRQSLENNTLVLTELKDMFKAFGEE